MDLEFDLRHSPGCTGGDTLGPVTEHQIYTMYTGVTALLCSGIIILWIIKCYIMSGGGISLVYSPEIQYIPKTRSGQPTFSYKRLLRAYSRLCMLTCSLLYITVKRCLVMHWVLGGNKRNQLPSFFNLTGKR